MKRLFCLTASIALMATGAFAQPMGMPGGGFQANERQGIAVYLRPGTASNAETMGLVEQLKRALEKSRSINVIDAPDSESRTVELLAPTTYTKDADGRVTVGFELTPLGGASSGRGYTTTCKVTQLDRCADAMVTRVERYGREMESFKGLSAPSGF